MSDIFVSYASADRERARTIAEALSAEGWSVWWDRVIPPGKQFDEVIEEALDAARCVVVLWTRASVASSWVKTEAAEAMRRKILIPALIEDVRIPLEFRRLQAADLSRWDGDRADPAWLQFVESVQGQVKLAREPDAVPRGGRAAPPPDQPPKRPRTPPAFEPPDPLSVARPPKRKRSAVLIACAAAAIVAVLAAAFYAERAKNIELAQTVRQRAASEEAQRERSARENAERERARDEAARQERERSARAESARAEAARAERERSVRAESARAAAPRRADAERSPRQETSSRTQYTVPESGTVNLQWRDHALGFNGSFTWSPSTAVLRAAIVDLKTGVSIGNYAVPAQVSQQGPLEYLVSAQFAIPADSTTPSPHTHISRLLLRAAPNGSVRMVQNCPRPGECY